MKILYNYIHGTYVEKQGGDSFDCINPASGEVFTQVAQADENILQHALPIGTKRV